MALGQNRYGYSENVLDHIKSSFLLPYNIYSRSWLEERQKVSVMERQDIKGNKTIHGNEYSKSNSYTGIRLISFATDVGPQNISRFRRFNN